MAKKQNNVFAVTAEAVDAIAGDALQVAIETASAIGSSVIGGMASAVGMSDSENVKSENQVKTSVHRKAKTVKPRSRKRPARSKYVGKARSVKSVKKAAKSSIGAKARVAKSATKRAR